MQWPTSVIKLVTCLGCKCIAQMLYRCFFFHLLREQLVLFESGLVAFCNLFLVCCRPSYWGKVSIDAIAENWYDRRQCRFAVSLDLRAIGGHAAS